MMANVGAAADSDPRLWSYTAVSGEERMLVPILQCGELYSYTIPSFSVITVEMRRIKYQVDLHDGSTKILDGFIREDPSLQRQYPAEVSVEVSPTIGCLVEVSEIERSIDVDGFTFEGGVAFVIWKWEWTDEGNVIDSGEDSSTEITVIPETPPCASDEEEEEDDYDSSLGCDSTVTHTVTFKCIGSTKENRYQEALARVAQLRNHDHDVPCQLHPEPDNPFDSMAIAFKREIDGKWQTIGYAVREVLYDIHEALKEKKVTTVSIDWVKFIIFWRCPGWYAGIKISRVGEWSRTVVLSQSARM